jgi:hypothetical protein
MFAAGPSYDFERERRVHRPPGTLSDWPAAPGHAATFWTAYTRSCERGGVLRMRNEDIDPQRSRAEFVAAMLEDLR